jgi:hypothetical protein
MRNLSYFKLHIYHYYSLHFFQRRCNFPRAIIFLLPEELLFVLVLVQVCLYEVFCFFEEVFLFNP